MRKKLLGIFVFFSLIMPMVGTVGYFYMQKTKIRKAVKHHIIAGISLDELTLLKVNPAEEKKLRWVHEKEFEWRGEMYDIVKKEVHGDTTFYWCWWDHRETQLNKKLDQITAQILGYASSQTQKRLAQFYSHLFFHTHSSTRLKYDIAKTAVIRYNYLFDLHCSSPPVPPPEV